MFIFASAPLFLKTNDKLSIKIIWSTMMIFFGVIMMIGAIHNMQYYYFEDNSIIVRSLFGIIVKLELNKVKAYIETLPTCICRSVWLDEKWICIYDVSISDNYLYRFKHGYSNKRKYKKIQIIFTEKNINKIEQYIQISPRNVFDRCF